MAFVHDLYSQDRASCQISMCASASAFGCLCMATLLRANHCQDHGHMHDADARVPKTTRALVFAPMSLIKDTHNIIAKVPRPAAAALRMQHMPSFSL